MIYVKNINGNLVVVSQVEAADPGVQCRWDWKTFEQAELVAQQLNKQAGAELYMPTEAGPNTSPRYDVIEAPQIGAKVSRCFNGDSDPCGTITKISSTMKRIETSDGTVFYRRKRTGSWIQHGTWSMIGGHHEERNPHL